MNLKLTRVAQAEKVPKAFQRVLVWALTHWTIPVRLYVLTSVLLGYKVAMRGLGHVLDSTIGLLLSVAKKYYNFPFEGMGGLDQILPNHSQEDSEPTMGQAARDVECTM